MKFSRLSFKMVRETRGEYGGSDTLSLPQTVATEAWRLLKDEGQEVVIVFFLNIKNVVVGWSEVTRGVTNEAAVSTKEIMKRALVCNACGIILAHNHPSGDPEPSAQDRAVTKRVKAACDLLEITLLDHVIVGADHYTSCRERGWDI